MIIAFRTDSSQKIGSGHVMRCLTLAEELRELGATVVFLARVHFGNIIPQIKKRHFKVYLLRNPNTEQQQTQTEYEQWLGVEQEADANETIKIIKDKEIKWLIVDHYALDRSWEEKIRPYTKKLMVIDDLANRKHDCDLLLDQNHVKNKDTRYDGMLSDKCTSLLGTKYALLQPVYAQLHNKASHRKQPLNNILIYFGGVDLYNLTGLTLIALQDVCTSFNNIDVVISKQNPNCESIINQIENMTNVHIYSDLPSLAHLMMKADFSIGAGGSTTWERFCLGLPTLVVTVADNQKEINDYLSQLGLIYLIGDVKEISTDKISKAINHVVLNDNITQWSVDCMAVCSGDGSNYVVKELFDNIAENTP
jgi:UDP-2,4-diacetamido-2,4,6-trideoxy-beta-L-altropyranose hydrolase